ncbi:GTPase Era [Candidatus Palibaumannia cicadellinicola]|uniref:GTPase Era n=1 Tax=Candidatus Palibaumannia cicadellinicola TaxID=186490 RepID=A0A088MY24_9GAMM|nr:GTPase Era [Candidatus Baumannia cicadellinicola]AIN47197.1 GTP-binding protein Era [Candidatus Baumannia cicadellinicola]
MSENITYCGFVAIVGRPNVGKSTLFNQLLGQKVSITSRKPQTTRHRILGINTEGPYQVIYIDTPGLHLDEKKMLNHLMNRTASKSIGNVELVLFVVEGTKWTHDDEMVVNKLYDQQVVLVINKVDKVIDKAKLLPHINFLSKQINFHAILPTCAINGMAINTLAGIVRQVLPAAIHYFPKEYITDRSPRFIVSEIIREKLIRFLGDELPYSIMVETECFLTKNNGCYDIKGIIIVESTGHKKILIGNQGRKIKTIGIEARQTMKTLFKTDVHLKLWVKVKSGWTNDECTLRSLGYMEYL